MWPRHKLPGLEPALQVTWIVGEEAKGLIAMAPKTTKNKSTPQDPDGIFAGMVVFLVQHGVQPRRLQVLTPSTFVLCF